MSAIYLLGREPFEIIYPAAIRDQLEARLSVHPELQELESLRQHPGLAANVTIVFGGWGTPCFDAALLQLLPKLEIVFYGAGSIRGIVSDAFWASGRRICSAYAANAVPVSEYALATILLSLKQFWRFSRDTRQSRTFARQGLPPGAYQSTVGLISLGMIGQMVARRLQSFDLRVLAYDPYATAATADHLGVELTSLATLFAASDVVSLHAPNIAATRGMITGAHFAAMRPGATFINTARGAIIREDELVEVLQQRPDLQAILDVTAPEPPAPDSPLYSLANIILTPHIAGAMGPECARLGAYMVAEVEHYLAGRPLQWEINRERAAIMA